MGRFIVRRLGRMALVIVAISILTFLIFQVIPNGDPAIRICGRHCSPQDIQDVRNQWGFDQSVPTQYVKTMGKILDGSVVSYTQQLNVEEEIRRDFPVTVSLALGAGLIWLFLGVLFGVISALFAGRWTDRALTVLSLIGISTPVFVIAALMLYFLAFKLKIFPNGDYVKLTEDPVQWLNHMILPWTALSVLFIGFYSRVMRSNILDTINEDYVRTARAKGLGERRVIVRHVVRNSLIPIVALWGLDFAAIIGGGAIITEKAFNLPGVGAFAANSIGQLDVPPILVVVMFGAFFVVLLQTVVDLLYALLDPRIRLSG